MTVILGGGIAGLSAAYYALKNPKLTSITLYEASNRVGGWMKSKKSPTDEIFEQGPRTIRIVGPGGLNTLNLIEELNLNDKLVPIEKSHPIIKNRLIYAKNRLHLVPNSFTSLFKTNSLLERPLFSYLCREWRVPKVSKTDESIYSFVERRIGKDIADYLISPVICGICAGDAQKISVHFLLGSLFKGEQSYGSITKSMLVSQFSGMFRKQEKVIPADPKVTTLVEKAAKEKWAVWYMRGGMEQLPLTLADNLRSNGLNIQLNKECQQLTFKNDHVEVMFKEETVKCSRVISSLAAKDLARLIEKQHPELSKELKAIPSATVGIVNLYFPKNLLPVQGFGVLVPPKEKSPILGITFDSSIFSWNSSTVLTVMMGGVWFEEYFGKSPSQETLLKTAVDGVKDILNIKEVPEVFNVDILKDCIPQHIVGHPKRLKRIFDYISEHNLPLLLCGSSYRGVGVNDVILHI